MVHYNDIERFLSNLHDELCELNTVYHFLQLVQRKYDPAPIIEIYAILKKEKPVIYSYLKQRVESSPSLKMMMHIPIDYQLAKKKLGKDHSLSV